MVSFLWNLQIIYVFGREKVVQDIYKNVAGRNQLSCIISYIIAYSLYNQHKSVWSICNIGSVDFILSAIISQDQECVKSHLFPSILFDFFFKMRHSFKTLKLRMNHELSLLSHHHWFKHTHFEHKEWKNRMRERK